MAAAPSTNQDQPAAGDAGPERQLYYAATSRRGAAVDAAVSGRFLAPDAPELLLVNFGSRVELCRVDAPVATTGDDDDAAALNDGVAEPVLHTLFELPPQPSYVEAIAAVPFYDVTAATGSSAARHAAFIYDAREHYALVAFSRDAETGTITLEELASGDLRDKYYQHAVNGAVLIVAHPTYPIVAVHTHASMVRIINCCSLLVVNQEADAAASGTPVRDRKRPQRAATAPKDAAAAAPSIFNARIAERTIDSLCFGVAPRTSPSSNHRDAPASRASGGKKGAAAAAAAQPTAYVVTLLKYGLDMFVLAHDRKNRRTMVNYTVQLDVAQCHQESSLSLTATVTDVAPGNEVRDLEFAAVRLVALPRGVAVVGTSQCTFIAVQTDSSDADRKRRTEGSATTDNAGAVAALRHVRTVSLAPAFCGQPAESQLHGCEPVPSRVEAAVVLGTDHGNTFACGFDNGAVALVRAPSELGSLSASPPTADKPPVEHIAWTSSTSCIAPLFGGAAAFVGSGYAASVFIDIATKRVAPLLDNIGPVMSMSAVSAGSHEQAANGVSGVVLASGAGPHGTLCHLRGGVSVAEEVAIGEGLDSLRHVFPVARGGLALVFPTSAMLIAAAGDDESELAQCERDDVPTGEPCVFAAALCENTVTWFVGARTAIWSAADGASATLIARWTVDGSDDIAQAATCPETGRAALAFGAHIAVFDAPQRDTPFAAAPRLLPARGDVSSLELVSWGTGEARAQWVVYGVWSTHAVVAVNVATGDEVELFTCDALPRGVSVLNHGVVADGSAGFVTVVVGTEAGTVMHTAARYSPHDASAPLRGDEPHDGADDERPFVASRLRLATGPVPLVRFTQRSVARSRNTDGVVCCGDNPAIMYVTEGAASLKEATCAAAARNVRMTSVGLRGVASCAVLPSDASTADSGGASLRLAFVCEDNAACPRLVLGSIGALKSSTTVRHCLGAPVVEVACLSNGLIAAAVSRRPRTRVEIFRLSGASLEPTGVFASLDDREQCAALRSVELRATVQDTRDIDGDDEGAAASEERYITATYLVAATAANVHDEATRQSGRVVVYGEAAPAGTTQLPVVCSYEVASAPSFAVCQATEGRILVSVGGSVELLRLRAYSSSDSADVTYELTADAALRVGIMVSQLVPWFPRSDAQHALYLAADAYNSVVGVAINPVDKGLELVRRDVSCRRPMVVTLVGDECLIGDELMNFAAVSCRGAEQHTTFAKVSAAGRARARPPALPPQGTTWNTAFPTGAAWHWADRVTAIQSHTTLACVDTAQHPFFTGDTPVVVANPTLFGTVGGAVGSILPLAPAAFAFLSHVAQAVAEVTRVAAALDRRGQPLREQNDGDTSAAQGVVNGDVVVQYLALSSAQRAAVATSVAQSLEGGVLPECFATFVGRKTADDDAVWAVVEEFSRLH